MLTANSTAFYKKMDKVKNGNGVNNSSQPYLRSILRGALRQVDRLAFQDKKTRTIRDVLSDLLQYEVPAAKQ